MKKSTTELPQTSDVRQPAIAATHLLAAVFFVGMHNKHGMKPLDSQTMSGKMIDAVINELPFKCTKTNLSEVEYMPIDDEIEEDARLWHEKYQPQKNDVIVLLGNWTHKNFLKAGFKIVKLRHPASMMGYVNKEKYVLEAIDKIMKAART